MLMHDIDIFMVTETKLDNPFPVPQFNVEGFSTPFRFYTNKNGGDIIFYICSYIPAGNYMFKVNNRNTRTSCEICSKLTIKTPERR